jgi:hypothetical protein
MSIAVSTTSGARAAWVASRLRARVAFLFVILGAAVVGALATQPDITARAVADSGADLTRLLRAMAAIKVLMAAGAAAGVLWRLAAPVSLAGFAAYAVAGAAMAAGPGLIWGMAHVAAGAVLLHAGLLATVVLLWRDPAVGQRLASLVTARRARRIA